MLKEIKKTALKKTIKEFNKNGYTNHYLFMGMWQSNLTTKLLKKAYHKESQSITQLHYSTQGVKTQWKA